MISKVFIYTYFDSSHILSKQYVYSFLFERHVAATLLPQRVGAFQIKATAVISIRDAVWKPGVVKRGSNEVAAGKEETPRVVIRAGPETE